MKQAIGEPLLAEIGTYGIEDLQKKTVQDMLAEKFNCSTKTVKRYIKKAVAQKSENELTAEDKAFLQKNSITLPKRLQGKLTELEYLKRYLTDEEELFCNFAWEIVEKETPEIRRETSVETFEF